jgi:fluoroquinolone transport system permease protein
MNATQLLRLMLWDLRVQARERIYLFTAITTAMFATAVALLPENAPATVVTAVLLLDPAVIGTGFVGGLVLLERSQNTPPALAVTPASPADYALAKLLSFVALTIAGGLAIVAVAYWPPSAALLLRMALALSVTGVLAVLGGLVMVATADSLNHLIARAFPVSIVVELPLLAHFGVVEGWLAWVLFGLSPGHAMLRALLWAADPSAVTPVELIYAFGYMTLLSAILFRWALSLHTRTIGYVGS